MTVDGMIQSPLAWTPVNHTLNGDISIGSTYFALSGITSLAPKDILKVDDEYMEVIRVGYGTTSSAIGSGSLNVVEVGRGFVGSISRGSFLIWSKNCSGSLQRSSETKRFNKNNSSSR